jgi:hypothetical protein
LVDDKYKDFIVNHGDLEYKPLNLAVVPSTQKQNVLNMLYENNANLIIGRGSLTFHKEVCKNFLHITRKDVEEFLKQQPEHLLTKEKQYVTAKPIIEKFPNARWQIDLIDMSTFSNSNYHYIIL